jgi:hypothetical protein
MIEFRVHASPVTADWLAFTVRFNECLSDKTRAFHKIHLDFSQY